MATLKALPDKLQMISGEGELFYSETDKFVVELKKNSTASSQYTVTSIIGPQSSGKSYILNTLFSTEFEVLDASKGKRQTTKGIWIAKCVNPCMIVMDVEGCDGRERGEDDTLFERQSALFSLTVSDVLLLNMWCHDIGRQNGANLGLIKLIFEERVKIEAPKTTIIILVRDYDYETPTDVTKNDLKQYMNELWEKVHPATTDTKMSDYIKVIVKDFPHKKEQQDFAQKCKELAKFLYDFAANASLEQKTGASTFAYSSRRIWDLIRQNKKLSAADHKLAMSTHVCSEIKDEILNSLDQEKGYGFLTTSGTFTSLEEFNRELPIFLERIFARYEKETNAYDENIRKKVMVKLQEETLQRFEPAFDDRIEITTGMLASLKSMVHDKMNYLVEPEHSIVMDVIIRPYMAEIDDKTRDVHPYFKKKIEAHRKNLEEHLTRIAQEAANKIRIERDIQKAKELQIARDQKAKELQIARDQKAKELQIERESKKPNGWLKGFVRLVTAPVTLPVQVVSGVDLVELMMDPKDDSS